MTLADASLQQLFALEKDDGGAAIRSGLQGPKATEGLGKALGNSTAIHVPGVGNAVADKVPDLLNIKIMSILAGAWTKYELLKKYADRREYPPEEVILLPLAAHTVKSEHHPYVEVLLNGRPVGKITFDVTVSLKLEAFELKLQDGKIKSIEAGSLQGSGEISLYGVSLVQKELEPILVHGSINLGEGISLRKLAAAG